MALTLESVVKYVPEFGGERKKHEAGENENPLTFHIKLMGAVAFRAFAAKLAKASEGKEETAGVSEEVMDLYKEAVSTHVVRIENLAVDGRPVTTGAEFYDHPAMPHDLVLEIERAVVETSQVTPDEAKN